MNRESFSHRLSRVRGYAQSAGVDALVVTHLPNIQYLTGFSGTAGAVILLPRRCLLAVDFRYVTAAEARAASLDGLISIETVPGSYDEAIVDLLRREGCERIGPNDAVGVVILLDGRGDDTRDPDAVAPHDH